MNKSKLMVILITVLDLVFCGLDLWLAVGNFQKDRVFLGIVFLGLALLMASYLLEDIKEFDNF